MARAHQSVRADKDLIVCRLDRGRQALRIGQRGQISGIDPELNGFGNVGDRHGSRTVTDEHDGVLLSADRSYDRYPVER
jgi:hypothetical protein